MSSPELFSCEVGLVDGRSRLTCCINLHDKSLRYYKSRRTLLAVDPANRLLRWAFRRLRAHARPTFLPAELLCGNRHAMPDFLHQLRDQKVESFIPLRLRARGERSACERMGEWVAGRRRQVLALGLEGLRAWRGQEVKRKAESTLPRSVDSSPPARAARSLSITYTRITLPAKTRPPDSPRSIRSSEGRPARMPCPVYSVRQMEERSPHKTYAFEPVDRTWRRTPPKCSSFQF